MENHLPHVHTLREIPDNNEQLQALEAFADAHQAVMGAAKDPEAVWPGHGFVLASEVVQVGDTTFYYTRDTDSIDGLTSIIEVTGDERTITDNNNLDFIDKLIDFERIKTQVQAGETPGKYKTTVVKEAECQTFFVEATYVQAPTSDGSASPTIPAFMDMHFLRTYGDGDYIGQSCTVTVSRTQNDKVSIGHLLVGQKWIELGGDYAPVDDSFVQETVEDLQREASPRIAVNADIPFAQWRLLLNEPLSEANNLPNNLP